MIRNIIIVCSLLLSFYVHAQPYFNFRFNYGQYIWWDGASNIFQLPDGYLIAGGNCYYSTSRLGLYKIDHQGNKVFSKIYGDTIYDYYWGYPGSFVRFNEGTIVASGGKQSLIPGWVHQEGVLYFLNNDGDTLFTRCFGDITLPIDTAYHINQLKKTIGNSIITVGAIFPYNLKSKTTLIKTDSAVNKIWGKIYGYSDNYNGYSVICTSDGGYAVGGYVFDFTPPPNLTGDPFVLKTDSAGNQQWLNIYGNPSKTDSRGMICKTSDGNMVLGTCYCDSMSGDNARRRINLIKLDNSGSIIWDKKYGSSTWDNTL